AAVEVPYLAMHTVRADRIVESRYYWDQMAMLAQRVVVRSGEPALSAQPRAPLRPDPGVGGCGGRGLPGDGGPGALRLDDGRRGRARRGAGGRGRARLRHQPGGPGAEAPPQRLRGVRGGRAGGAVLRRPALRARAA